MPTTPTDDSTDAAPLAWRPDAWLRACGHPFSRPKLYSEIAAGKIDVRKVGRNLLILTSPSEYLASLPRGIGAPVGRGRRERGSAA
jgi:hypothetical protein